MLATAELSGCWPWVTRWIQAGLLLVLLVPE